MNQVKIKMMRASAVAVEKQKLIFRSAQSQDVDIRCVKDVFYHLN